MAEDEDGEGAGQRQHDHLAALFDDPEQSVQGASRGNRMQHIDTDGEYDEESQADREIYPDRGILRLALSISIDEEGKGEGSKQRPHRQLAQIPHVQPQRRVAADPAKQQMPSRFMHGHRVINNNKSKYK